MTSYLLLTLAAALLVTCEAGYYLNRDAANLQGYYRYKDANQQRYGYYQSQDRDANQQRFVVYQSQDRDANQQRYGYYQSQDRDANQQRYGYYQSQDRDANKQRYGYYQSQDRDANQQRYGYYQSQYRDANQQAYRKRNVNQQYGYYGYRHYYTHQQAASCLLQIDAPSQTFTICIKPDEICTNVSVPACGSSAMNCQPIGENNEALNSFRQKHRDVYAEECKDTSGGYCLYTDVTYNTCSVARDMENKICVKLSDGTERCSNIQDLVNVAANDGDMPSNQMPN